jgi:hypothetical protein
MFLTITVIFCSFFRVAAPVWADLPSDLVQGIGMLSQYRSNAEYYARALIGLAASHEITKQDYRRGQSLYAEARAAFDGWIDQLMFEVQAGGANGLSHQYETMEEVAQTKGNTFIAFAREQFQGQSRGIAADALRSSFATMREVGQGIVKGFTQVSGPERQQVMAQLQGYKWPAFEMIEQER